MLKKHHRLTKRAFDESFKRGKRFHTPSVQLIYDASTSFHGAVVVGKKVYKRAVDRNRLRRQLYSALYRQSKTNSLSGTYILVAKPAAKSLTKKEIPAEVSKILQLTHK